MEMQNRNEELFNMVRWELELDLYFFRGNELEFTFQQIFLFTALIAFP